MSNIYDESLLDYLLDWETYIADEDLDLDLEHCLKEVVSCGFQIYDSVEDYYFEELLTNHVWGLVEGELLQPVRFDPDEMPVPYPFIDAPVDGDEV